MGIFSRKSSAKVDPVRTNRVQIESKLKALERYVHPMAIGYAAMEVKDGEIVEYAAVGEYEDRAACLVLTNERIIICALKGLKYSKHVLNYEHVDRVDVGLTLKGSSVTFYHGSEKTEMANSAHGELDEIREIVKTHRTTQKQAESSASSGAAPVQDIEKLAQLHAAGILTDEEFSAAKAKALGL